MENGRSRAATGSGIGAGSGIEAGIGSGIGAGARSWAWTGNVKENARMRAGATASFVMVLGEWRSPARVMTRPPLSLSSAHDRAHEPGVRAGAPRAEVEAAGDGGPLRAAHP